MKKKFILIFAIYTSYLVLGLISCNNCGPFADRYKVIDVGLELNEATIDENDNLLLYDISSDTINFAHFACTMDFETETYFAQHQPSWNLGIMNTALACTPAPPTSDEVIDSIAIIALENFDSENPAGSNLVELFDIYAMDYYNETDQSKKTYSEYMDTNPSPPNSISFLLKKAPETTREFNFILKYYQDGIELNCFELEMPPIVISL